jgi:hypothetical protein
MSKQKMSKAARSLYVFSFYLFFVAFLQLFFPSYLIKFMGPAFPESASVFVQFSGMLFLFIAFYYIEAALHELTDLLRWTIYTRASTILFFSYFVIVKGVSPLSLMFGVIDLAGAIWTYSALRASRNH